MMKWYVCVCVCVVKCIKVKQHNQKQGACRDEHRELPAEARFYKPGNTVGSEVFPFVLMTTCRDKADRQLNYTANPRRHQGSSHPSLLKTGLKWDHYKNQLTVTKATQINDKTNKKIKTQKKNKNISIIPTTVSLKLFSNT